MINLKVRQKGFTIIELLIATSVFSVILLVITSGFMQIGRAYYRGLNESRVQGVTRAIVDEVAQTIQFSGANNTGVTNPPGPLVSGNGTKGYCIGSTVYSYRTGVQIDGTNHALVAHTVNPAQGCGSPGAIPQNLPAMAAGSRELLGDRMRVAKFEVTRVTGTTDLYSIVLRVVYGDDELLCRDLVPATCSSPAKMLAPDLAANDLKCKSIRTGTQFCATSELKTTVQRRI